MSDNGLIIRKASKNDISYVAKCYRELLVYEKEHGSNSNWILGLYPTRKTAEAAFREDALYVLEKNGEILGSVILNHSQPDDYSAINWLYEADNSEVLVIHTLCILPSAAGKGLGKKMLAFAKDIAGKSGCKAVRLDTWAENRPAASLYTSCGFRPAGRGMIMFEDIVPEEQIYFELKI